MLIEQWGYSSRLLSFNEKHILTKDYSLLSLKKCRVQSCYFLAFIYFYVKASITIKVNVPCQKLRLQYIYLISTFEKDGLQGKLWMCSIVGCDLNNYVNTQRFIRKNFRTDYLCAISWFLMFLSLDWVLQYQTLECEDPLERKLLLSSDGVTHNLACSSRAGEYWSEVTCNKLDIFAKQL